MSVRRAPIGLLVLVAIVVIAGCGGEQWPTASSPPPTTGTTTVTTTPPDPGGYTEEGAEVGNQGLFDDTHTALEATFRTQRDPKFTSLSYNAHNNVVIVTFVYRAPASESRSRDDDFAWHTTQTIADSFWFPELVQSFPSHHADPAWLPKLRIQIDEVTYICPALVQIAVAAHRITEHEWLTRCAA